MSRLPRRSANQPSVADLVKRYQDFLPPQGVHDLTKTAFAPRIVVSESEQEYNSPLQNRTTARNRSKHRIPRNGSISDFEQGYAANIAPRYINRSRRSLGQSSHGSRIPAPAGVPESRESSRRPSPDKHGLHKGREIKFGRHSPPPPPSKLASATPSNGKGPKARIPSRTRDKTPARQSSAAGGKSTFRRQTGTPGSKVSNMVKYFERPGRDAERSKSRYNVIRGRRARPVASARAKVEVLESVQDAIKDESSSSDSSSEADDEGDEDEGKTVAELVQQTESPVLDEVAQEIKIETTPPDDALPVSSEGTTFAPPDVVDPSSGAPSTIPLPPSPFLKTDHGVSVTPPHLDETPAPGTERNSILKAISGFWLQPPPTTRSSLDSDDLMVDPEHIFRDSSMVVRTDEPTSIIALALKYVATFRCVSFGLTSLIAHHNTERCLPNLGLRNAPTVKLESRNLEERLSCPMIVLLRNRHQHGASSIWTLLNLQIPPRT